jgi:hypothetical protein
LLQPDRPQTFAASVMGCVIASTTQHLKGQQSVSAASGNMSLLHKKRNMVDIITWQRC